MGFASLDEQKAKNVLRQVEFYFSDSNLPRDNFLRKSVEDSDDGLVDLALICSFTRMKSHLSLDNSVTPETVPTETIQAVAEVLGRSSSLRLSEDGRRVGRNADLSKLDEVIHQVDSRTIAAFPFPYDVKLEDVESFFAQHAKVNSIRLPRHVSDKRHFCGTALIEFSEEEDARRILKESLIFAGADIELKPKVEFDVERSKKEEEHEKARAGRNPQTEDADRNSQTEDYTKGLILAFKLKQMSTDEKTEEAGSMLNDSVEDSNTADASCCKDKVNETEEPKNGQDVEVNDRSDVVEQHEAGTGGELPADNSAQRDEQIIKETSNGKDGRKSNPVTREDLKAVFQKFGMVKYIDFKIGEESGYIRFDDPKAVEKARAFAVLSEDGGVAVKNQVVSIEALSGDDEKQYWNMLRCNREKHKDNKNFRGRGGRQSRGGRYFEGKRGRHKDASDGGHHKIQKLGGQA